MLPLFAGIADKKQTVSANSSSWRMLESFAGSGLVAYGLKGMFDSVWANDISERKAAIYAANIGDKDFVLDDIKNIKGYELPFAIFSWGNRWNLCCKKWSCLGVVACIRRDAR